MGRETGSAAKSLAAATVEELDALIATIQDAPPSPEDGWFDTQTISERMQMSAETARSLCVKALRAGKLEKTTHRGRVYYRKTDIDNHGADDATSAA